MYSFRGNKTVVDGIDDLYAYLKGRFTAELFQRAT